jgi:hypothetical protein
VPFAVLTGIAAFKKLRCRKPSTICAMYCAAAQKMVKHRPEKLYGTAFAALFA